MQFTTIEEMEVKIEKVKELTKEILDTMNIQFPLEEEHFNHLSTYNFCKWVKVAREYIEDIEKDLEKYKKTR